MASLGHVALGVLAGRIHGGTTRRKALGAMAAFGTLSMVPDCDVVPLAFGVRDAGLTGHRGITHTVLFAAVGALCALLLARRWKLPAPRTVLLVFLTLASHGVLDAATTDSRGVPLLWPLTGERLSGSTRPIPVAPTGLEFASLRGLEVAAVEVVAFLPALLLALYPPARLRRAWARRPAVVAATFVAATALCLVSAQMWLDHSDAVARVWSPPELAGR